MRQREARGARARNRQAIGMTLAWGALLLTVMSIHAGEPATDRPYSLKVVLHFAENRFLTPVFQEQVERDLRAHLQQALGDLAEVDVVRKHPKLREVLAKGLQQALDGWDELSDERAHFVLIEYANGRYEMQARHHDGMTGLSSAVVRREQTMDRLQVARLAAQLVDRDFGLSGLVVEAGKGEVTLAIHGGKRGVDLSRWLKKGDVFAVVRVQREGNKLHTARLPWAVLQALESPRDGQCRCRYFHRFEEERLSGAPGSHRCLQLATAVAPVRLRLIDDKTFQPLDGMQVHVSQDGFGGKARQLTTNADGLAVTKEAFANLAFVRVLGGSTIVAQFPVPLVDERTIVCRLRGNVQAAPLEALEFRKDLWVRRIYDSLLAGAERVKEIDLLASTSLEAALARSREGSKIVKEELDILERERLELLRHASELRVAASQLDLREGEQRLEELRGRLPKIVAFQARLEAAIKESGSDERKALLQLLERARLKESQVEIDDAIALYDRVLKDDPGQTKVRAHVDKLKKSWALRSREHGQAREFLLKVWPRTEVAGLKAALPEAKKAFETCRKSADDLTPRKIPPANLVHAANLRKRLNTLKRQDTEDNRVEARALAAVAQGLMEFHREVAGFVAPAKKQ